MMTLATSRLVQEICNGLNSENKIPEIEIVLIATEKLKTKIDIFRNVERKTTVSPSTRPDCWRTPPNMAGKAIIKPSFTILKAESNVLTVTFAVATTGKATLQRFETMHVIRSLALVGNDAVSSVSESAPQGIPLKLAHVVD